MPIVSIYKFSLRHISKRIPLFVGMLITLLYFMAYFSSPFVPGKNLQSWWTWSDQSRYLASAYALAHGLFRSDLHWYPLGYSLLGAPFIQMSAAHPFMLPDLGCLLLA